MKKYFTQIIFFTFLYLSSAVLAFAQVSNIAFTTSPQTVSLNIISEPITIQAQDGQGNPYQTPETIDLEFISSSLTGEFLGSTGNSATKYMSTNTANRTFYYKDSTEGSFTITVNATGRDSGKEWSKSQQIIVSGSGETLPSSSQTSTSVSNATTKSTTLSSSSVSSGNNQLDVSISGGDRMTIVGSPISFQAIVKKSSTKDSRISFNWSYGDGTVGTGQMPSHTYKYVGDYVVVLNAKDGNNYSVSRIKVKVLDSSLAMKIGLEFIEITNNSNNEINLFNWKLISEGRGFIFQPDTIILPHATIKIDNSLLTMTEKRIENTVLMNFLDEDILVINKEEQSSPDFGKMAFEIESINQEALVILEKLQRRGDEEAVLGASTQKVEKEVEEEVIQAEEKVAVVKEEEKVEPNIIYEAPKEVSFVSKLTNFIKRVLFD